MLSFKNENDRIFFYEQYIAHIEIKEVNVLIDGKDVFDTSIKNKEEKYEKIIETGKNNDCTASSLLDY